MKAATLASLLVTSAAAGAAAAGGPFFFAQTTPYSIVTPATSASTGSPIYPLLNSSAAVTVPVDLVLTDLCTSHGELVGVEVNGVMTLVASVPHWSASDGAGIPITAGSSVVFWAVAPGRAATLTGYHY